MPPIKHPKDRKGTKSEGIGRRHDLFGQPLPMPKAKTTKPEDAEQPDWASEPEEYVKNGSLKSVTRLKSSGKNLGRLLGFVIDRDSAPLQTGAAKPSRFNFEYIQKGKYRQLPFRHRDYDWSDFIAGPAPKGFKRLPRFDWNDQADVEKLNNWRRQSRKRVTFEDRRPASQSFSQAELDFLYMLSKEALDTLLRRRPDLTRDEALPFAVPSDLKKQWMERFNKKFVGTMPPPHKEPIRPRETNALMTQRHRYKKLQQDFKLADDVNRRGAAGKKKVAKVEKEGSEEEESESDDDSDITSSSLADQKRKRDDSSEYDDSSKKQRKK